MLVRTVKRQKPKLIYLPVSISTVMLSYMFIGCVDSSVPNEFSIDYMLPGLNTSRQLDCSLMVQH